MKNENFLPSRPRFPHCEGVPQHISRSPCNLSVGPPQCFRVSPTWIPVVTVPISALTATKLREGPLGRTSVCLWPVFNVAYASLPSSNHFCGEKRVRTCRKQQDSGSEERIESEGMQVCKDRRPSLVDSPALKNEDFFARLLGGRELPQTPQQVPISVPNSRRITSKPSEFQRCPLQRSVHSPLLLSAFLKI